VYAAGGGCAGVASSLAHAAGLTPVYASQTLLTRLSVALLRMTGPSLSVTKGTCAATHPAHQRKRPRAARRAPFPSSSVRMAYPTVGGCLRLFLCKERVADARGRAHVDGAPVDADGRRARLQHLRRKARVDRARRQALREGGDPAAVEAARRRSFRAPRARTGGSDPQRWYSVWSKHST
jgi:hypothetical protein